MLQWLTTIERSASGRRREKGPSSPQKLVKQPPQALQRRDSRHGPTKQRSASNPLISRPDSSSAPAPPQREKSGAPHARMHKRSETAPLTTAPVHISIQRRHAADEEEAEAYSPRHFTVANVGQGGTLYLTPSRLPAPYFAAAPLATPDARALTRCRDSAVHDGELLSDAHDPRPGALRDEPGPGVSSPLLSPVNPHALRIRSHSFSTVRERSQMASDSLDQRQSEGQRRRSAQLLRRDLSDVHIPHYRLGTPHFTARGTAYLHYSVYASSSHVPSSTASRTEYENLFPLPLRHGDSTGSKPQYGDPSYLHHSSAYGATSPSQTLAPSVLSPRLLGDAIISPALFDKLAPCLEHPDVVRYDPATGRIVAATPARLIAQITSPQSRDYELLEDFFLTFRCFMPTLDVLEFLFARMRWAFDGGNDAGRIARVRTFVALRHWIQNYFPEDLMGDVFLRQSFCNLVNDTTRSLRQRIDGGGGDMQIIGELKKCWRRTCSAHWPTPSIHASPDADIVPCGEPQHHGPAAFGLPLTIRPTTRSHSIFEMTQIQLPGRPYPPRGAVDHRQAPAADILGPRSVSGSARTASIPASPMSEESLEVLSCSVPFLRHARPPPRSRSRQRQRHPPRAIETQARLDKTAARPARLQPRRGSYPEASRGLRKPPPHPERDVVELKDLSSFSVTGGLVRGMLLQPSDPKVDFHVLPVTPPGSTEPESPESRPVAIEASFGSGHNAGVKRFVGGVRKALVSRKGGESPSRGIDSATASDSEEGLSRKHRYARPERPQPEILHLQAPRVDVLGLRIQKSYQEALEAAKTLRPASTPSNREPSAEGLAIFLDPALEKGTSATNADEKTVPGDVQADIDAPTPDQHDSAEFARAARLNSRLTTGSRSIVIVDDTRAAEALVEGVAPSFRSMSSEMMPIPLFRDRNDFPPLPALPKGSKEDTIESPPQVESPKHLAHRDTCTSEDQIHDLLDGPNAWRDLDHGVQQPDNPPQPHRSVTQLRRSSPLVSSTTFDVSPIHPQLRRRPGGDLKANEHVHDMYPDTLIPSSKRQRSESKISASTMRSTVRSARTSRASRSYGASGVVSRRHLVNLTEMRSSQPMLRASFVGDAERLRQLPEPAFGGIEDALMKLEGKIPSPEPSPGFAPLNSPAKDSDVTETQGASIFDPSESGIRSSRSNVGDFATAAGPTSQPPTTAPQTASQSVAPDARDSQTLPSNDVVTDSSSVKRRSEARPRSREDDAQSSFLLDDDQSFSDISTDIASCHEDGMHSFFFDDTVDCATPTNSEFPPSTHLPTPPPSAGTHVDQSPDRQQLATRSRRDPSGRTLKETISAPKLLPLTPNQPFPRRPYHGPKTDIVSRGLALESPGHLPFILAFDAAVIAEQLTIIEKDALDEVTWEDLVSLNWQQSPGEVRNWVEYLQTGHANGIDVVIARFNLAVKWCVSEIVLTASAAERARALSQFIRTAAHCRRMHNYATTYQLVLALLSTTLARLSRTWSLVPARDRRTLAALEALCRPSRNFHALRAAMEAAPPAAPVLPFIGLYTHDLASNALKPQRLPVSYGMETHKEGESKDLLVNFERCQTAATIVKTFLRLKRASGRYDLHAEPGCLSRCLWIACLDDDEIEARSMAMEGEGEG